MIVLMGSGETSPTMVELHKSLVAKSGGVTVVDTPYGFQANADELTAKTVQYFAQSVGVAAQVATLRRADLPASEVARALAAVRASRYVFAGPGSPTYALEQWGPVGMVDALESVVRTGGVVTLASAASVSSGALTLPVYEMYKVGKAPFWLPGLDLMGRFGFRVVVVPHFNNTDGVTHDTSCCYVGRARLDVLRAEAPDIPVLGIDEHTALVLDTETGTAKVLGQSSVHVLVGDREHVVATGGTLDLRALLAAGGPGSTVSSPAPVAAESADLAKAVEAQDPSGVLDALLAALPADPALGAAVAALEPVLDAGWSDRTAGYVDLLLAVRAQARAEKQWALSDLLRDGLAQLGQVVEDTPDGQRIAGS